MTDLERDRRQDGAEDEIEETLGPAEETAEPEEAAQQDFATRNVLMSNALPGGSSPVAGAVIGSGGEMGMDPSTEEPDDADADADADAAGDPRPERRL